MAALLYIGIALVFYGIYNWVRAKEGYFNRLNVKHLKPYFLVGNTGGLMFGKHRFTDYVTDLYNTFTTEKIFGFFNFRTPMYFIRDPELVKRIGVTDFDHFEDHPEFLNNTSDKLFGNSLIMLRGEKWRDMRATLSPAFTGSKMRQMFDLITECAADMATYFKEQARAGKELNFEMKQLFSKYTNDVIATSAFGIKVNSFENSENEFYTKGKILLNFGSFAMAIRFMLLSIIPVVMRLLNIGFLDAGASEYFRSVVLDTLAIRDKTNITRPDMINIMLQVKKGSLQLQQQQNENETDGFATVEESSIGKVTVKRQWNDDEIVAQCFLFFAAGFETSSTLLSLLSYELAVNSDVQEKLFNEIASYPF